MLQLCERNMGEIVESPTVPGPSVILDFPHPRGQLALDRVYGPYS